MDCWELYGLELAANWPNLDDRLIAFAFPEHEAGLWARLKIGD